MLDVGTVKGVLYRSLIAVMGDGANALFDKTVASLSDWPPDYMGAVGTLAASCADTIAAAENAPRIVAKAARKLAETSGTVPAVALDALREIGANAHATDEATDEDRNDVEAFYRAISATSDVDAVRSRVLFDGPETAKALDALSRTHASDLVFKVAMVAAWRLNLAAQGMDLD